MIGNGSDARASERVELYRRMEKAGWWILSYSLVELFLTLYAFVRVEDPDINILVFAALYVGYRMIYRSRFVVMAGLVVFVLYDLMYGLSIMLMVVSPLLKMPVLTVLNVQMSWVLIPVAIIGCSWCLINTYLCWDVRSRLNQMKNDREE